MSDLHFDLHGLSVSLELDDDDLRAFVKEQFETKKGTDPDAELHVKASWRWGKQAAKGPFAAASGPEREKVGRDVTLVLEQGVPASVLWQRVPDFPELKMSFELEGDLVCRLNVTADCAYVPEGMGRKLEYLRRGRVDRKRNRLFFKLMYFMVYYPLVWMVERTRGWGLLHASAVTLPSGKAVILSGLGGVGKSTLGLSLLSRPGARLLSDNLIFHDEERIYSCPEPVRLDEASLKGMAEGGVEPQRTRLPLSAHPKPTYRVASARRAAAALPAALYFLRFASRSGVTSLRPGQAAEMLLAGNDLAREIKDYRPCSSLLTMLAAERGAPPMAKRASLARLLEPVRCAVFRIGEGEKVADTAARLAERVEAIA